MKKNLLMNMKKEWAIGLIILLAVILVILAFLIFGSNNNMTGNAVGDSWSRLTGMAVDSNSGCTDSDGGRDYNLKGEMNYGGKITADSCVNANLLNENYCTGNENYPIGLKTYYCMNGCSDGACVEPGPIQKVVNWIKGIF